MNSPTLRIIGSAERNETFKVILHWPFMSKVSEFIISVVLFSMKSQSFLSTSCKLYCLTLSLTLLNSYLLILAYLLRVIPIVLELIYLIIQVLLSTASFVEASIYNGFSKSTILMGSLATTFLIDLCYTILLRYAQRNVLR